MHITFYKPPGGLPIPPPLYGGTQRIIYWLGKALVQLGHRVTLIHDARSHIPGAELRPLPAHETEPRAWCRLVPDSADIIHLFDMAPLDSPKPVLVGCNGFGLGKQPGHPNTVFVSRRHAELHGSRQFVWNGIDPGDYRCSPVREDYAVFLAKARWDVKNLAGAVDVARRAGVELRVLGSRNWPFNLQKLLPPLRGVRYLGMVGGPEKLEQISRARCLIFPVRWEEPFGIAVTEALASGAYIAGTPYGALPEIVTPETGVLSTRAAALVDAVKNPGRFSPAACRERVWRGGFTHLDMARRYVTLYERILANGSLLEPGEAAPRMKSGFNPKNLLPWER